MEGLNLDAIREIEATLMVQLFHEQTVRAGLAELVGQCSFVCPGNVGIGDLPAVGVKQSHEQIAWRPEAAGPAGENQALIAGGWEFIPVAVLHPRETAVRDRRDGEFR